MTRQYQHIGRMIEADINAGALSPGDRLPTERDYAERFGVSRTVVREAFIMLELAGRVSVRKGSGTYVRHREENRPTDTAHPESEPFPDGDIGPFELLNARQVVESAIAASAAQLIPRSDLRRLQQLLDDERDALSAHHPRELPHAGADAADRAFHLGIAEASQNTLLHEMATRLWDQRHRSAMWQQLHSRILDFSYRENWLTDHDAILARLRKRDGEGAHQAMWHHLENVKATLMTLSDTDDPRFDGYLFNQQ
ncbi:GntR family transcriptional regulator [Kushneria sinocarnis]|uniref:GntR family transcriptional regulator n=1 Tax=Kushneria sinocarnis TaxID=595502 RepID=A0A420WXG8_9GAMM|nr:FCD domain-containing protein [Kushneria sinocarnis]RKR04362.1 GntR family transcriptional regulator [Kushneria sinocarnis]